MISSSSLKVVQPCRPCAAVHLCIRDLARRQPSSCFPAHPNKSSAKNRLFFLSPDVPMFVSTFKHCQSAAVASIPEGRDVADVSGIRGFQSLWDRSQDV